MNEEKFVHVTYIAAKPEKVWAALLEAEFTWQYWQHENVSNSNWAKGSKWRHVADDGKGTAKIVGEVLENVPQKRLVLSCQKICLTQQYAMKCNF